MPRSALPAGGGSRAGVRRPFPRPPPWGMRAVTSEREPAMKFFVDTAEIDAIAELHALGMVDGVTATRR